MSLEFSDVRMEYKSSNNDGDCVLALESLSVCVDDGESIAIIGPSGCGKSTMLRLATGLISPTEGEVKVDGNIIESPRNKTALVLQDFGLLPWKTVYENAELGLLVHKVDKNQRVSRTLSALEKVGLSGFEKSYPSELSGGMQQRLALARAIAVEVDLLLMDEPLSALDALLREELQNLLLEIWKERGHSQILVTHSIEEAVFLGQRILVMAPRPGRIIAQIDNSDMGDLSYRGSAAFFERCKLVREALASGGDLR